MRIGILFGNSKKLPVETAVKMATAQFSQAEHTQGYSPAEVRFNPAQMPQEATLYDLVVIVDERVPLNHIRVCTREIGLAEEFEIEKALFAGQVEAALTHSASLRAGHSPSSHVREIILAG